MAEERGGGARGVPEQASAPTPLRLRRIKSIRGENKDKPGRKDRGKVEKKGEGSSGYTGGLPLLFPQSLDAVREAKQRRVVFTT